MFNITITYMALKCFKVAFRVCSWEIKRVSWDINGVLVGHQWGVSPASMGRQWGIKARRGRVKDHGVCIRIKVSVSVIGYMSFLRSF